MWMGQGGGSRCTYQARKPGVKLCASNGITLVLTYAPEVKIVDDTHISIDGNVIEIVSNRDPTKLPWKKLGVQIVIEGTGVFIDTPGASKHLEVGGRCTAVELS
jgi:glyceraldehyde-3-phosphate dehydrogenase/erythrose-4-phosphate dehydrogenase